MLEVTMRLKDLIPFYGKNVRLELHRKVRIGRLERPCVVWGGYEISKQSGARRNVENKTGHCACEVTSITEVEDAPKEET
jgi:hypothetical protein